MLFRLGCRVQGLELRIVLEKVCSLEVAVRGLQSMQKNSLL